MSDTFDYRPPTEPWQTLVYEDRDMVVLDKQAGLLTIPGRVHPDSALSRLAATHPHTYAVHRLDMDTSGLLVIALRRKAERELHRQFRERTIKKQYIAVVNGIITDDTGNIELPLSRATGTPPRSFVDPSNGKPALTQFRVLERSDGCTRLLLRPRTGRSHQLRVHLLAIGHPIVGDRFYGPEPTEPRMLLHASQLVLAHPFSGETMRLESPAPF
jgi:tRNA pseudouridine32 synthase/23S rRNA pseudouridine746 synthase